jgi:hypothetical protein
VLSTWIGACPRRAPAVFFAGLRPCLGGTGIRSNEVIKESGLKPDSFHGLHDPEQGSFTVRFKPQRELWFRFVPSDEGAHAAYYFRWFFSAYMAPRFTDIDYHGDDSYRDMSPFEDALAAFRDWLTTSVSDYLDDRAGNDLWQAFQLGIVPAVTLGDEDTFSDDEVVRIEGSLHRLLDEVRVANLLTKDQLGSLTERVDYLVQASRRMGKKDWAAVFTGSLVGFAIHATLSAPVATSLLRMAGTAIQWLFTVPTLPP